MTDLSKDIPLVDSMFNDNSGGKLHIYGGEDTTLNTKTSVCKHYRTDDPVVSKDTPITHISCRACSDMFFNLSALGSMEAYVYEETTSSFDDFWATDRPCHTLTELDRRIESEVEKIDDFILDDNGNIRAENGVITPQVHDIQIVKGVLQRVRIQINGVGRYLNMTGGYDNE